MKDLVGFIICWFLVISNSFGQVPFEKIWIPCNESGCVVLEPYFTEGVKVRWNGPCLNNKAHGEGVLIRFDHEGWESTYKGNYNYGIREGYGQLIGADGTTITGMFSDGHLNGYGVGEMGDGIVYKGNFINNEKHGEGVLFFSDTLTFTGFYVNGTYTGTYVHKNGTKINICKGENCDTLDSLYSNYLPSLDTLVTEYFDIDWQRCKQTEALYYRMIKYQGPNKPQGIVKEYYISGNLYREYNAVYIDYEDQNKIFYEGLLTEYYDYSDQEIKKTMYFLHNKLHGQVKTYFRGGNIESMTEYYYGFRDGPYTSYHENGVNKINGTFDFNDFTGIWKIFKEDGSLMEEIDSTRLLEISNKFSTLFNHNEDLEKAELYGDFLRAFLAGIIENEVVTNQYLDIAFLNSNLNNLEKALDLAKFVLENVKTQNKKALINTSIYIGVLFNNLNRYHESLIYSHYSLKNYLEQEWENSETYLHIIKNIGSSYFSIKQFDKALYFDSLRLKTIETLHGKTHPEYVESLENLAITYSELGKYNDALIRFKEVLAINETIFGKNHPEYASSLNNLGSTYSNLGDYKLSLKFHEEALLIRQTFYGKSHPHYASSLNNLAGAYRGMGKYDEALKLFKEALLIREAFFGKNHSDYTISLNNLADTYSDLGQYNESIKLHREALNIRESIFGKKHPDYALSLNNLAGIYSILGQYDESLKFYYETAQIWEAIFGKNHHDYALCLNNLANTLSDLGKYNESLPIHKEALKIRESIFGKNHPDYALSLNNLASTYNHLGQYNEALTLHKEALKIRESIFGKKHPDYALSLNNIASTLSDLGQYNEALSLYKEALKIREDIFGNNHPEYALSLNNLGSIYGELGQYNEALTLHKEALKIREDIFGKNHPDYAISLSNLASTFKDLGQYNEALILHKEALKNRERNFGKYHPDYALSLNNIASTLSDLGQYNEALSLYKEALKIREEIFGKNHPDYALSLNNLAGLYDNLNMYREAIYCNKEALVLIENLYTKSHPYYALSLNNLASLYYELGLYDESVKLNIQALNIRMSKLGSYHPDYAQSLNNLSTVYSKISQYEKALVTILEALNILEKNFGKNHPNYASSLNNLALIYSDQGFYENSITIYLEISKILENINRKNHPTYALNLNNLACVYNLIDQNEQAYLIYEEARRIYEIFIEKNHLDYANILNNMSHTLKILNKYEQSLSFAKQGHDILSQQIALQFSFLTESEKDKYILSISNLLDIYFSICFEAKDKYLSSINDFYKTYLGYKGTILASQIDIRKSLQANSDKEVNLLYQEWIKTRQHLAKLYSVPLFQRWTSVDSLERIANKLEGELSRKSSAFKKNRIEKEINIQDFHRSLSAKDCIVDIGHFRYWGNQVTDSIMYVAFVFNKNDSLVNMIPLFEERQFLEIISKSSVRESSKINNLYRNTELYNLIWKPIEKFVKTSENIYFSPSGMLNQVNIGAIMDSDSSYLCDKYKIYQVSSATNITKTDRETQNFKNLTIFGGMDFEASEEDVSKALQNISKDEEYVSRGLYIQDSARHGKWTYLPGTKKEAENIYKISTNENIFAKIFTGADAIEEQFKNLDGEKSPSILHLATHGFFFPDPKISKEKVGMMSFQRDNTFSMADNPMNRSGLLFSGSNKAWIGDSISVSRDDGILTAYEASHTYLKNTELVVLSACETGLGDIKGSEGVYGLQRAFKMAGARYLMMSLWKVPDNASQEFMTTFYTELLTNKLPIRSAYKMAQNAMKAKYRNEPYKWAGFVLME